MCNDKGMKRFGWVFVTVTVLLITITPAIANVYVYDPWLSYHTERNYYLWLAPFNLSVLSIWINYYLACRTNPGYVNSSYQPQQNKVSAKPRWCKDCLCYKAPRAHHCSLCNKCIKSMDHHCPWVNNCVGYYNHSYFIKFLGSVTSGSLTGLLLIALRIWDFYTYQQDLAVYYSSTKFRSTDWIRYTPPFSDVQIVALVLVVIVFFVLLFTVGLLFLWQLYYSACGMTTIESFEMNQMDDLKRRHNIERDIIYPFDLGIYRNLTEKLGPNPLYWMIPWKPLGDGLHFITNNNKDIQWPPREYFIYKKYPAGKPSREHKKILKRNPLVRRGSEGYIVTPLSASDREAMVQGTYEYPEKQDEFSSTDFDSLEDSAEDEVSDNETLADRKSRIKVE